MSISSESSPTCCPHCNTELVPFELPDQFDHEFDLACFNDDCPYYVRGWSWMDQHYAVRASYRYRVDSQTGFPSPIAVWSAQALKDRVLGKASTSTDEAAAP